MPFSGLGSHIPETFVSQTHSFIYLSRYTYTHFNPRQDKFEGPCRESREKVLFNTNYSQIYGEQAYMSFINVKCQQQTWVGETYYSVLVQNKTL